jgi:hypothetical protein
MWKGLFLRIRFNKNENLLVITGNRKGFELLSDYSLGIIGKHTPAGHQHFQKGFGNVTNDSIDMVLYFSDNDEDYHDKLIGRDSRFKIIFEEETVVMGDKCGEEILLMGDKNGLEAFAELCREVISKQKPIRLDLRLQNVMPDSIPTILQFKKKGLFDFWRD